MAGVVDLMVKRLTGRLAEVVAILGAIGDGTEEVGRNDEAAVGRHVESEVGRMNDDSEREIMMMMML